MYLCARNSLLDNSAVEVEGNVGAAGERPAGTLSRNFSGHISVSDTQEPMKFQCHSPNVTCT